MQGSWFGVQGLGFRVQGLGFRVQGLGFRVKILDENDLGGRLDGLNSITDKLTFHDRVVLQRLATLTPEPYTAGPAVKGSGVRVATARKVISLTTGVIRSQLI